MPEAIPSILAPYLRECFRDTSLALVTSTLSTPANWLLIRFLHTALSVSTNVEVGSASQISSNDQCRVIFVSLLRPPSQWLEAGRKIGVDLAAFTQRGQLMFVEGLVSDVASPNTSPIQSTLLNSGRLDDLLTTIHGLLKMTASSPDSKHHYTVIIDGLDFLLASQPDADVINMQHLVSSIQSQSQNFILSCSADSPLLHNRHEGATRLEREHSAMITSLSHQSSWIFQLRALDTGAAKDVTGVLRVSKGGSYDNEEGLEDLDEGEWLYQLKGDGSAKVWPRGQ